ncbi:MULTISPECIES: hypothetical protein [Streptomycetaceae]|uniref:Uncharacterized protein n=1 Tax=Streptantibioticus cattleyicolor (strain ATCC 35852 / DSM 46488 / JCM 4925 / NBRC 14057 / NRRL 8057) TaxID=1003195 RepID=F8JZW6_STREN|nr:MULTISPECIES: hypothetical protein [Streptomycetaceae]AEW93552.1 hypothetical protein SCATT_11810 [Streptantibioticus cattleyicolor NRRL 8057 = DSM 46488]CCB73902.1 protein of unknown function [Streptantibioticus cattleyicolor NRRL 8057 = DSM 46488]
MGKRGKNQKQERRRPAARGTASAMESPTATAVLESRDEPAAAGAEPVSRKRRKSFGHN